MNCEKTRKQIDQMSPEDLQNPADRALSAHLATCEACREYRDKSVSLIQALDCWEIPQPRKSIEAGVMAGIARLERDKNRAGTPGSFWEQMTALFRYRFQVPALAAACLVLLLGISVMLNIVQIGRAPQPERHPMVTADGSGGTEGDIRTVSLDPTPAGEEGSGNLVIYQPDGKHLFDLDSGALSVPVIVILGAPPNLPLAPDTGRRLERSKPVSRPGEDKI